MILLCVLINILAQHVVFRIDLTSEKRFTLAAETHRLCKDLNEDVLIKVYLDGSINPGFNRLHKACEDLLNECKQLNSKHFKIEFTTPSKDRTKEETAAVEKQLYEKGLIPEDVYVKSGDKSTAYKIFPGAIISYKGREKVWPIFNRQSAGVPAEICINNSIEDLEYTLTNTIRKLQETKRKEITFLDGHGELDTLQSYRFRSALAEYYNVNHTAITPGHELRALRGTDLLVIAQPDSEFTDREKYVIDQFIMQGGKTLWLIDPLSTNLDSLRKGFTLGLPRPLHIEDMLFKYGVRLNTGLLQDRQCGYLRINVGYDKGQPRFELFPWLYSVLALPQSQHPIVRNLDLIKLDYCSTLDTVSAPGIHKTFLLQSSRYARIMPAPVRISLASVKFPPREAQLINYNQPIACLLEGTFSSFTENRLPQALLQNPDFHHADVSLPNKMIIIADGDVARNEINFSSREILPLGFDRNTNQTFANATFLLNCVNYLLDDEALLNLRSREVKLRLLDKKLIILKRLKWQTLNVLVPLLSILILGGTLYMLRKRQFEN
jgi:ABC-2 type transport system permease protein